MKDDIKQFLETGILESYVLGIATAEETVEAERYIREYPEVKKIYEEIQEGIEQMARSVAVPVPKEVKSAIDQKIDNINPAVSTPKILYPGLLIAASIIALVCASLGAYFWNQSNQLNTELGRLNMALTQLENDCAKNQQQFAALQEKLELIQDPNTGKYILTGNQSAPQFQTVAYWNTQKQSAYLQLVNMPILPDEQCFQLWADVDGKMLSLGVIPADTDQLIELPYLADATSLNITIEPKGGSDHPDVSRLVASKQI